ncbi:D-Ala-D-Ala carboxypeptidase family metallohydrolase [Leptolyngbya sp. PCC 6406]|uniref:D-Ala-D-Ala carboxypeptidase family metallohydrolase n=1 Tax=Leptolyngbya sp. PCC 6406 TaxID=1173264 RepID=UPI00030CBA90|nr:D-Ala-D-Ala carboxypeptidase family metallohydrolase [Leptolyngbya sp. PCC 6406]
MRIKVTSDTLFKLAPKLSSELSEAEKVFVKNGTEFEIEFYTEVEGNHLQLELANAVLGNPPTFTWYAYKPDLQVTGSPVKLTVTSDTLFKLRPVLSSELADEEKVFVKNGTQFEVQSFLPADGNHVRVAIANAFLGPQNRNTWYAYNPDIKIDGQKIDLRVISDTLFKGKPVLSSQLADNEKIFVRNKTTFELQSYSQSEGNHVRVALSGAFLGPDKRNTWYAFGPDIQIDGTETNNKPKDTNPAQPTDPGKALRFPGFSGVYYTNNPILTGGRFTWGEATHGGSRIPVSADVVYGMLRIAKAMEEIRKIFGNRPVRVNSWYRDPATNARVGGASASRHIVGDAVDFVIGGYHPYDVFAELDRWWGSKGGLASATVFTHIDSRGYRARWSYGF